MNQIGKVRALRPGELSSPQPSPKEADPRFKELLGQMLPTREPLSFAPTKELQFSSHAVERMRSRGIKLTAEDHANLLQGIEKAKQKGAKTTLVLMDKAAFIVGIKNETVITAMDRAQLKENVFTNIDSTVVV